MQPRHFCAQRRKASLRSLDDQQEFLFVLDLSFPAVNGANTWDDAGARGQPGFDQRGGNLFGFFEASGSDQDHGFIGHRASVDNLWNLRNLRINF